MIRVPELANGHALTLINKELPLVNIETIEFLKSIEPNSTIIEIEGGLGEISEYLSNNHKVYLLEEIRLFFVYRRKIFQKSTVIEMNTAINNIIPIKQYYKYAIIHNNNYLDFAKKIAKIVFNISTKEIHGEKFVDSIEELREVSKNNDSNKKSE